VPRVLAQERTRKFVLKDEGTLEASIFVGARQPVRPHGAGRHGLALRDLPARGARLGARRRAAEVHGGRGRRRQLPQADATRCRAWRPAGGRL